MKIEDNEELKRAIMVSWLLTDRAISVLFCAKER